MMQRYRLILRINPECVVSVYLHFTMTSEAEFTVWALSFIIIYWEGVKAAELSQTCVGAPDFPEWTEILMMVINNTIISPKTRKPSEHHLGVSAVTERDREECCCYDMTTSAERTHTHTHTQLSEVTSAAQVSNYTHNVPIYTVDF